MSLSTATPDSSLLSRKERNRLAQQRHRLRVRKQREELLLLQQQQQQQQQHQLHDVSYTGQDLVLQHSLSPGNLSAQLSPWQSRPDALSGSDGFFNNAFASLMGGERPESTTALSQHGMNQLDFDTVDAFRDLVSPGRALGTASASESPGAHQSSSSSVSRMSSISSDLHISSAAAALTRASTPPSPPLSQDEAPQTKPKRPYCEKVDGNIPAGRTPLHMLCERGSKQQVARFIAAGADSTAKDEYGMTPLHIAARRGNTGAISAILDAGFPVDDRDKQGWTPLHHASWCSYDEAMILLIRRGASSEALVLPENTGPP